jgi:hypothetical protein
MPHKIPIKMPLVDVVYDATNHRAGFSNFAAGAVAFFNSSAGGPVYTAMPLGPEAFGGVIDDISNLYFKWGFVEAEPQLSYAPAISGNVAGEIVVASIADAAIANNTVGGGPTFAQIKQMDGAVAASPVLPWSIGLNIGHTAKYTQSAITSATTITSAVGEVLRNAYDGMLLCHGSLISASGTELASNVVLGTLYLYCNLWFYDFGNSVATGIGNPLHALETRFCKLSDDEVALLLLARKQYVHPVFKALATVERKEESDFVRVPLSSVPLRK